MVIERMSPISSRIENHLDSAVDQGLPLTHAFIREAENMRGNLRPGSITSRVPKGWHEPQAGGSANRSTPNSESSQSPWRPSLGPWRWRPSPKQASASAPAPKGWTDLRQKAVLAFRSSAVSLKTGLTHSIAAITNFRDGKYLPGLHYAVSAPGYFLTGVGQFLDGISYIAKATGRSDDADNFQRLSKSFGALGSPLAGMGRSLRDLDTALATLANPASSFFERQRDLQLALGTILNAAGASGNAASALTGNPDVLLQNVQTAIANSGTILRGFKNLQRNAEGLSRAFSPLNPRNVLAYSAGVAYGCAEAYSGMCSALAHALKVSGYTRASEALSTLGQDARNVFLLASNAQILINSLVPATR